MRVALSQSVIYGFSPSWAVLQTILFMISTGLAVFDIYTDWQVVLNFQEVGFNNPLLPRNIHWLRSWFLFAFIGTLLTTISVFDDGIGLLYTIYQSCKKGCCKSSSSAQNESTDRDDEIDDPCICCYRCGFNHVTRNETLGAVALWSHSVPMLTISVLYAFSQSTCKVPDTRDVTPVMKNVGISATVATLVSIWRVIRSFARMYSSVGVRMECSNKRIKKCLPKKGDVVYPPKTRIQHCIFLFYFGLIMQMSAIFMGLIITFAIWVNFASLQQTPNFDDSLGIYRFSLHHPDVRLFNISGTIIPPNGTFVNLERIPSRELTYNGDVFCLSEFEYRSKEFQIFFNAIQLVVISDDGRFCASNAGPDYPNVCISYYTLLNFVLYYASVNPNTGTVDRFDRSCSAVSYMFNYDGDGPVADFSLDVTQHINRTGFPENDEPLIIFYPIPINIYLNVSSILSDKYGRQTILHTFQDLKTPANVTCVVEFAYDVYYGRINFNYREVYNYLQPDCYCGSSIISLNCFQFHQNLVYAYLSHDHRGVPYTQCSEITQEKLVPYHHPFLSVDSCPCS